MNNNLHNRLLVLRAALMFAIAAYLIAGANIQQQTAAGQTTQATPLNSADTAVSQLPKSIDLKIEQEWNNLASSTNESELSERYKPLRERARTDAANFVRHSLLYALDHPEVNFGSSIGSLLGQSMPEEKMLPIVVPLMKSDARTDALIHDIFEVYETRSNKINFSGYDPYLRLCITRPTPTVPDALIRYMLQKSPSEAMRVMTGAYCKKGPKSLPGPDQKFFLISQHRIEEYLWVLEWDPESEDEAKKRAAEAVEKLAARDEWWSRAYVAQLSKTSHALFTPEILEKLRQDSNEIVKQIMTER